MYKFGLIKRKLKKKGDRRHGSVGISLAPPRIIHTPPESCRVSMGCVGKKWVQKGVWAARDELI